MLHALTRPMRAFAEGLCWLDRYRKVAEEPPPNGLPPLAGDDVYALAYAKGYWTGQEEIIDRFVGYETLVPDEIYRRIHEAIAWSNERVDRPTVRPAEQLEMIVENAEHEAELKLLRAVFAAVDRLDGHETYDKRIALHEARLAYRRWQGEDAVGIQLRVPIVKSVAPLAWAEFSPEERLAFIEAHPCCHHCGSLDERCQCDNDE